MICIIWNLYKVNLNLCVGCTYSQWNSCHLVLSVTLMVNGCRNMLSQLSPKFSFGNSVQPAVTPKSWPMFQWKRPLNGGCCCSCFILVNGLQVVKPQCKYMYVHYVYYHSPDTVLLYRTVRFNVKTTLKPYSSGRYETLTQAETWAQTLSSVINQLDLIVSNTQQSTHIVQSLQCKQILTCLTHNDIAWISTAGS